MRLSDMELTLAGQIILFVVSVALALTGAAAVSEWIFGV